MQKGLSSPRLLIVQTGSTQLHGDYPRWFERTLGSEMPVTRAHEGEQLGPALDRVRPRGIIVSGSPLSVTERVPWMLRLGDDRVRAAKRSPPKASTLALLPGRCGKSRPAPSCAHSPDRPRGLRRIPPAATREAL